MHTHEHTNTDMNGVRAGGKRNSRADRPRESPGHDRRAARWGESAARRLRVRGTLCSPLRKARCGRAQCGVERSNASRSLERSNGQARRGPDRSGPLEDPSVDRSRASAPPVGRARLCPARDEGCGTLEAAESPAGRRVLNLWIGLDRSFPSGGRDRASLTRAVLRLVECRVPSTPDR